MLNLLRFLQGLPRLVLIFLVVVIFISAIIYTSSERAGITPVEKAVREALAPLQKGTTNIITSLSNYKSAIFLYRNIQQENEFLRQKIIELSQENDRLQEYKRENARLRALLDFEEKHREDWKMEPAHVIARNYDNWYHTITIDKGSNHNIEKDMPVVNYQGLVGRIINVTSNTSEVLLIVDPDSAVGALVQLTRVPGIIETAAEGQEKLQMVHVPHDEPLPEDSVLITSGLGEIFPKGLKIGYITGVELAPDGFVKKAHVRPFVNFDSLEEVFIIKEWRPTSDLSEEGAT